MPQAEVSDRELRLLRMRSQGLLPATHARTVSGATSSAFCVQAQDVGAASLAIRARTRDLTAAEVAGQARRRALCRAWLMRNTLHLFATRDLAWMRPLLAARALVPARRRLAQLGVSEGVAERVLEALRERLSGDPALPRSEAVELIKAQGVRPGENNSAVSWLLHLAALEGVLVIRPALDRRQVFAPAPDGERLDRDSALGRLARRYLEAYGPAAPRDFAYWGKITLADARRGWELAGRLIKVVTTRGALSALPRTLKPLGEDGIAVRLLALWDNFLLGHEGRELVIPRPAAGWVHPGGGLLKPTAFADGRAFATWRIERRKGSVTVEVEPFDRLPRGVKPALEREATDLGRFLGTEARLSIGVGG